MTRSGAQRNPRVLSDASRHSMRVRRESFVFLAGENEHRHGELPDAVPERFLSSSPAEPERRRKAGRFVPQPCIDAGSLFGQVREQRTREPATQEIGESILVVASPVELVRERLVGINAGCALPGVFDSCGHTDEHGAPHDIRAREREMEKNASAERVSDVVARAARLGNQRGGFWKPRSHRRGPTVTGEVGGNESTALFVERTGEGSPATRVLSESVQENHRLAGAPFERCEPSSHAR